LYQMCITIDTCMFYFYLAVPVGSVLMIIFLLPKIMDEIRANPGGVEEGQEKRF